MFCQDRGEMIWDLLESLLPFLVWMKKKRIEKPVFSHLREMKLCMRDTIYALPI